MEEGWEERAGGREAIYCCWFGLVWFGALGGFSHGSKACSANSASNLTTCTMHNASRYIRWRASAAKDRIYIEQERGAILQQQNCGYLFLLSLSGWHLVGTSQNIPRTFQDTAGMLLWASLKGQKLKVLEWRTQAYQLKMYAYISLPTVGGEKGAKQATREEDPFLSR